MITTLLNADTIEYYTMMEADHREQQWVQRHPLLAVLREWLNMPWRFLTTLICRWYGHDLEDSGSYAGPDSGADDLTCRRCGWNFHHIYY